MLTKQLLEPKLFWRYNVFWIVWLALISYLSNKQSEGLPAVWFLQFEGADKLVHFVFYFTLSILILWGFKKQNVFFVLKQNTYLISFLFSFSWGGLMELAQKFIFTYRSAEWADQIVNSIGAILAIIFFRIFIVPIFFKHEIHQK